MILLRVKPSCTLVCNIPKRLALLRKNLINGPNKKSPRPLILDAYARDSVALLRFEGGNLNTHHLPILNFSNWNQDSMDLESRLLCNLYRVEAESLYKILFTKNMQYYKNG